MAKPHILRVLICLSVCLTVVACGSTHSAPSGQNRSYQKITVGVGAIPTSLDPGQNGLRQDYAIMQLVAGTLTVENDAGTGVYPGLASSVTGGGLRWVVTLRKNLKFSDGTPLTSRDVVASFDYYLKDKSNEYAYTFAPIKAVTMQGAWTVVFDLREPYPDLPVSLAYPSSTILPISRLAHPGTLFTTPVPTAGPYVMTKFGHTQIVLMKNRFFVGPPHSVEQVTFNLVSDPTARLAQVQGGELNFADGINQQQAKSLPSPLHAQVAIAINGVEFLEMNNTGHGPLSNVRVRKAIALAVNREQINQVAYGGLSKPALSFWASNSPFSQPFLSATPELAAARALLRGTQCQHGCTIDILARADEEDQTNVAQVTQQDLTAIGITTTITTVDASTESSRLAAYNYDIDPGFLFDVSDIPLGVLGFGLDPEGGADALQSGYSDPEMHKLIVAVDVSTGASRAAAVRSVNALYERDLPYVPLVNLVIASASQVPDSVFSIEPTMYYHVG